MRGKSLATFALLTILCGCGKNHPTPTATQTATVTLKDGTSVTGSVMKTDTSSITIQSANGVVSTYPMTQVSSVNYGLPPSSTPASDNSAPNSTPAAQNTPPSAPAPAQGAPPASYPPPQPYPASNAAPPPDYHPAETFRVIPAGTTLEIRTNQTIDAQTAAPGQTYSAVVVRNVMDKNGGVAIPHGAGATLVVRDASRQGKVQGRSELVVDVGSVNINGHPYRLETSGFVEKGREGVGANKRTAEFTGGGGLFGTIIGAVAGGGKGAAIGALSGAAAGAATQSLTRGKPAVIPAEAVLRFRLEAPIRIREMQ